MNNFFKQMLLAAASFIAPIIFTYLSGLASGFPLDEMSILSILVWIISYAFGGAKLARAKDEYRKSVRGV